jgi:hypothetical protein
MHGLHPSSSAQEEFLRSIFMHGVATGRQAVQSSPPDVAVAAASLGLLCRVMEWDFRHTQLPSAVAARRIFDPSEVRMVCRFLGSSGQLLRSIPT